MNNIFMLTGALPVIDCYYGARSKYINKCKKLGKVYNYDVKSNYKLTTSLL